ncbi:hypothetical protein FQN54_005752 [Arachnomyces sp. PD_36]|nr:hypothetical protein FQN54_005752 [Arachnomyces sp. PD_36]
MSEYWKSTPKYWCKHCKTYVRDTSYEKTQHEATGKHQGNLKRFLRDIHRGKEREERENQKAKDEVQRLNGIVAGSGSGSDKQNAPWNRKPVAPPVSQQATANERKRQVAQLAEMGVAVPQEFRGEMALAGDWQTISERTIEGDGKDGEGSGINIGVRKRKYEGQEEEEEAGERVVKKGWGSTTRKYPGFQEEDEDLDALLKTTTAVNGRKTGRPAIKAESQPADATVKSEKVEGAEDETSSVIKKEESGSGVGSWIPENKSPEAGAAIKAEDPGETDVPPEVAKESSEGQAAGVVFKKRKPKHARK